MNQKAAIESRLVFVGCYGTGEDANSGGINLLEMRGDGSLVDRGVVARHPREAGYLKFIEDPTGTGGCLYAVDERKTDGRGPVQPPAAVHSFRVHLSDGRLEPLNQRLAPGPRPTFLGYAPAHRLLLTANHGDFQHVEKVFRNAQGEFEAHYLYDDSTVIAYTLEADGQLGAIHDLVVLEGHGLDPNRSPQAGGHAQASPHAHCAVVDPSGRHVVVCDKGTDRVLVYRLGERLEPSMIHVMPEMTGPRHIEFAADGATAYMTCEFSSRIAVLDFDFSVGVVRTLGSVSTLRPGNDVFNEPAEIRLHPNGRYVYVNNRGEDSLSWFEVLSDRQLAWRGSVLLGKSLHPGVAARSFAIDPSGHFLLVADRSRNLVQCYSVNATTGTLVLSTQVAVVQPACIEMLPNQKERS